MYVHVNNKTILLAHTHKASPAAQQGPDHFTSLTPSSTNERMWASKGWRGSLLFFGFSIMHKADLHMAKAHSNVARVDKRFPMWTKANCKFPQGWHAERACCDELMKLQELHGYAKVASPPCTSRKTCRIPKRNPKVVAKLWSAMSFSISTPCLGISVTHTHTHTFGNTFTSHCILIQLVWHHAAMCRTIAKITSHNSFNKLQRGKFPFSTGFDLRQRTPNLDSRHPPI